MNADDIARLRAATKKGRIKITSRITIRNRIKIRIRSKSRNDSVAKKLAKKASFCRCVLRIEQGGRDNQTGREADVGLLCGESVAAEAVGEGEGDEVCS